MTVRQTIRDSFEPSADTNYSESRGPTTGVYVGTSGNIEVVYANGTTDTIRSLAGGVWHPMEVIQYTSGGTTVEDIRFGYGP